MSLGKSNAEPGELCFNHNVLVSEIQFAVAEEFGLNPIEMVSDRRYQPVARCRQLAMYLARELTPYSLPNLGRMFGKRDHSTVIHGIRTAEKILADDAELASKIEGIRSQLIHRNAIRRALADSVAEAA